MKDLSLLGRDFEQIWNKMLEWIADRSIFAWKRRRWRKIIAESGLFDDAFYSEQSGGTIPPKSALTHYVRTGMAADRLPSSRFDPVLYRRLNPDIVASGEAPILHYLRCGRIEGRLLPDDMGRLAAEIDDLNLFDPKYYIERYPEAASSGRRPIDYFIQNGLAAGHSPSAAFEPDAYVELYPDVAASGQPAVMHYVRYGRHEKRDCPPCLDAEGLRLQLARGSHLRGLEVRLARMEANSYFSQYNFTFETSGPTTGVPDAVEALSAVNPLLTIDGATPDVSIVIPVYGQMPFLLGCLHALSYHHSRFSAEIIVADDASPSEHRTSLLQGIPWIRYERSPSNRGFLDNCNAAANLARGRHIVLLNSDTWVIDGWLDELIGSFGLFPRAGFVGSKLMNGDGTLQEAGGIYWSDGTAWNYGRNRDREHPLYSFARQVDWVSGASIAVPRDVWRTVGGFDEVFRPAYCEDVDLAFRIRELGLEVWFQPFSRVLHFEGMTHGRDEATGIKAYQVAHLDLLRRRWEGRLPGVRRGGVEPDREARRSVAKTMLVIDATSHMPDRDAGSVVASEIMRTYRELGFHQTFVPLDFSFSSRYAADYQRLGVEVLYGPYYSNVRDVLRDRAPFDYVLIFRYPVAQQVIEDIREASPMARILFSNVDLHFLRMEREAALLQDREIKLAAARAKTDELSVFAMVDCSVVHTQVEKDVVASCLPTPIDNILVLPWIADPLPTDAEVSARRHVMFLGGFPHTPNVDAVKYFVQDVWPQVAARLPADAKFLAVGNAPPDSIKALASDRIDVTGHVPTVEPYFAQARVFVAPLRYGAGIKGKVIQSLANGVPTVATSVAVEGIDVVDGEHCLVADTPEAISTAILRLFAEPDLWARLRDAGLAFVEQNYSANAARALAARSLDVADATWLRREDTARNARLRDIMVTNGATSGAHVLD